MRLRTRSGFASITKTPTFPVGSITLPICAFSNAAAPSGCAGVNSRIGVSPSSGALFVVRSLQIEFLAPAIMDDLLVVETNVADLRGASIDFKQRVLRSEKELVTAEVLVASIRDGRPARISPDLRRLFEPPS